MLRYKIVSDGPLRRERATSFPDQQVFQLRARDVIGSADLQAMETEAFTDESAIDWFDLSDDEMTEATEQNF